MAISDWFKARERRRYTALTPGAAQDVPEGVWSKCPGCKRIVYQGELEENLLVCPHCAHHFQMPAGARIEMLADDGTFLEWDVSLTSVDPLSFRGAKTYRESLDNARAATGLREAVLTGSASVGGREVVLGAMDFGFIGASMGSVVGEKVARAFERALEQQLPVVLACASGGARMQEGMLSLLQMAKTSAAVRRHGGAGLAYVCVLTHPTMGGVTASFATLADVVVAEPGSLVGFSGARVIEQTIRQKLPKGFQSSEFMADHGMVDSVVDRLSLSDTLADILAYLAGGGGR